MATTDPIAVMEGVLAYAGRTVHGSAFASAEELQPLVTLGVLVPDGHVPDVPCVDCAESHPAPVVATSAGLRAVCDRLGSTFTPEHDLTIYRVRPAPVVDLIAANLDRRRRVQRPARDSFFWSLGSFSFRDFRVGVFLLVGSGDLQRLDEALGWLGDEPASDALAVLTIGLGDLGRMPLPRAGRMVRFSDVVTWSEPQGLTLDRDVLARSVLPQALLDPVRRGRPGTKFEQALQLIAERDADGALSRLPSARARHLALRAALYKRSGGDATISRQTSDRGAWADHITRRQPKQEAPRRDRQPRPPHRACFSMLFRILRSAQNSRELQDQEPAMHSREPPLRGALRSNDRPQGPASPARRFLPRRR